MNSKFDIFICYRRDGGFEPAKLIYDKLRLKGYYVFLDVEKLERGKFDTKLYSTIEQCTDFIVILSTNALERCKNEGDWVKNELSCALTNKKNIIPVFTKSFAWPDLLPDNIEDITKYHGLEISHDYFEGSIDKLTKSFLKSHPRRMYLLLSFAFATALLTTSSLYIWLSNNNAPKQSQDAPVASAVLDKPPPKINLQSTPDTSSNLPQKTEQTPIQAVGDMKIGDKGWCDPGALYVDKQNIMYIRKHSIIAKDKTDGLKIFLNKRTSGIFADITRCNCKYDKQFSPTDGDIPVDEVKLFLTPSETIAGDTFWANTASIYADSNNNAYLKKDSKLYPVSSTDNDIHIIKSNDGFSVNLKGIKNKIQKIGSAKPGDIPILSVIY